MELNKFKTITESELVNIEGGKKKAKVHYWGNGLYTQGKRVWYNSGQLWQSVGILSIQVRQESYKILKINLQAL